MKFSTFSTNPRPVRSGLPFAARGFTLDVAPRVPVLLANAKIPEHSAAAPAAPAQRTKIWSLGPTLHCSIIGTCITNGELRGLLRKFNATSSDTPTDHELHSVAVSAVGKHGPLAKQIQKALDRRHRSAIHQFAAAAGPDELQRLWSEAIKGSDIPGGYWALLTHPQVSDALIRRAFGDVHMLSHLVGAANRADIRRLAALEEEKAALEEKLARQQESLRLAITARDAKIRELAALLSAKIASDATRPSDADDATRVGVLERLVTDLRRQLDAEVRRRERAENRGRELTAGRTAADRARAAAEAELDLLRAELNVVEARLDRIDDGSPAPDSGDWSLTGWTILYVGGRTHHIARLRSAVEAAAGTFLHHDGGIEEKTDRLAGLISRADVAVFPVDCVSHAAAQAVKRHCHQFGRPYVPLRSSGLTSLLYGLRVAKIGAPAVAGG